MVEQNIKEVINCICSCINTFTQEGQSYVMYTDSKVFIKHMGTIILSIEDDVVYDNIYKLRIGTIEKQTLYSLSETLQYLVSINYRNRENINI